MLDNLARFRGIPVTISDHALEETDERLFPASKHRSKRIHKKLIQRYGSEFRKVPVMLKTPQGLLIHPALAVTLFTTIHDRPAGNRAQKKPEFPPA